MSSPDFLTMSPAVADGVVRDSGRVIFAGDEDRLVDIDAQSARLHRDVHRSRFRRVPGTGHMIHQTATGVVMSAVDEVASARSALG